MVIYFVIGIIVVILIYGFITYNNFVNLNNRVKEAFSTMDVYLKKRWNLVPNLVETVKGYAGYEKSTVESVILLRNAIYDNLSNEDKIKKNEELSSGISKLIALAENYPDLKASENFKDLSNKLTKIEDDIANSRKYYNGTVRMLNNKVEMFPSNLIASIFGFKTKKMFSAEDNERENINISV